jgi:hypothetical protein
LRITVQRSIEIGAGSPKKPARTLKKYWMANAAIAWRARA